MIFKRYGFCFVFDPQGRVLVLRRAAHMRARALDWDLPGGTIDEHEDVSDGVLREVFEETALVIVKLEKVTEHSFEYKSMHYKFYYFRAQMIAGEPLLSEEHDKYEWHEPLIASSMITYKPHLQGYEKLDLPTVKP